MNIYFKLLLSFLFLKLSNFVGADPCNKKFGGCDKNNGLCWGTGEDTHFCTCKVGFEQDLTKKNHHCKDIDECAEKLCDENAVCKNSVGSYTCTCKCGYVKDYTGQYCLDASKIKDICLLPAQCRHSDNFLRYFFDPVPFNTLYSEKYMPDQSRMVPVTRSRQTRWNTCKCEEGFQFNRCGLCVDRDECARSPCKGPRSTCTNTEGSFYCGCKAPYVLGPCKERCYRQREVPELCSKPKLTVLFQQGFTFRTYADPITLNNYRSCADGVETGDTTKEKYDLDHDNTEDIHITWVCDEGGAGGSSVLKQYAEEEARWDLWSCWTACKATPWGGIQTRVRKCLHGLPSQEGCLGEGSEKRECYTGPKKPYRIRKDAENLSEKEKKDLFQAMKKYKADTSARGFFNAAAAHGWPFQCDRVSCCPHAAKMKFITWHRSIVLNYEEGLNRYLKDKTIGLPYWNWLRDNRRPPALAWNKRLYGEENPFANMTVRIDQKQSSMRTIQRDNEVSLGPLDFAHDTWLDIASKKKKPHIMHEWASSTESAHGGPHVSACGGGRRIGTRCIMSLATLDYAGFDPLFMFHHSQVDRLWEVAIKSMADNGSTTWSTQTALENFEERGDFGRRFEPFHNTSLNPFPIVQATNTMRDSYYLTELTGVKYDSVVNNGFPPLRRTILRSGGNEILFIGHYFQSTFENVYVNYYMTRPGDDQECNTFVELQRFGSVIRLGNSRIYSQTIPTLTKMEKIEDNTGLDIDFFIKACYTSSPTCKERCPEVKTPRILSQPDPMLVYYMPNQPVDIYKFIWAEKKRVPGWYINLHSASQWIYFFGDRSEHIRQVRNAGDYLSCNAKRSKPFRCSAGQGGKACILPSGIYYLIDATQSHCRSGLRMIIVARK